MKHRFSLLPKVPTKRSLSMKGLEIKHKSQDDSQEHQDTVLRRRSRALNQFFSSEAPSMLCHKLYLNKNPPTIKEPIIENHYNRKLENTKPLYRSSSSLLNKLNNSPQEDITKDQYYSHLHDYFVEKGYQTKDTTLCQTKRKNSIVITNYLNEIDQSPFSSFSQNEPNTKRSNPKSILNKSIRKLMFNGYNKDYMAEMVIAKYVKRKAPKICNEKERALFVILDGTVVINENVDGIFVDIPSYSALKAMSKPKRVKIAMALLSKCTLGFQTPQELIALYHYNKHPLYDLIELGNDRLYIYASNKQICSGINLVPSKPMLKMYDKDFESFINERKAKQDKIAEDLRLLQRKRVAMRKFTHTLRDKLINQMNRSFTQGYSNEYEQYEYYSDNEERKKIATKQINEYNCLSREDFQAYLLNNQTAKKLEEIKQKLTFTYTNPFNLNKLLQKYKCNFDKVLHRFLKEQHLTLKEDKSEPASLLTANRKLNRLNIEEFTRNIAIHNLQQPSKPYDIIKKAKDKYPFVTKNAQKDTFYHNMDKNIAQKFPDFLSQNIPKYLQRFKKFDRQQLYQTFGTYKLLIALCYGLNKSELIIKNGIDFDTFWKCVREISSEKREFVEKLFSQINKTKSNLLSIQEFFEGMMFIQSTDLKEKLDLFLKTLDQSGKGILSFDDVISICTESINRNLCNEKSTKQSDNESLSLLSTFFAEFIFQLLDIDKKEHLPLDKIKTAIVQGSIETQYLEMFCGANKIAK